jgi:hypothetical protein
MPTEPNELAAWATPNASAAPTEPADSTLTSPAIPPQVILKENATVQRLFRGGLLLAATTLALTAATAPAMAAPAPTLGGPTAFGGPTAAAAKAPVGLPEAKRLTVVRIDGRLVVLRAFGMAIRNAARLSDGHQSTLQGIIDADLKGLTALRAKVLGETTVEAVKLDAQSMVQDYRVYILVRPQVHLTIAADAGGAAVTRLRTVSDTLAKAIAAAKAAGQDTSAAEAKLADLNTQLDAAQSSLTGVADTLLAVKPGPDAAAIKAQVQTARGKVREARGHLKSAIADAKQIRDLLRKK